MKDMVTITCYGKTETMDRQKAINKFTEGLLCSEGSERERYAIILSGLMSGLTNVDDEI